MAQRTLTPAIPLPNFPIPNGVEPTVNPHRLPRSQSEVRIRNTQIQTPGSQSWTLVPDRLGARKNNKQKECSTRQEAGTGSVKVKVTGALLLLSAAEAAESRSAGSSRTASTSSGRAGIAI